MGTPQEALHRTILLVDVVGFGKRDEREQREAHRALYAALRAAFQVAGVVWSDEPDWDGTYHEDRGDGVMALLPCTVVKSRAVRVLVPALAGELRRYNHLLADGARLRLRVALAAGEVSHDGEGAQGEALVGAFRLLDAAPVKQALASSPGALVLVVSGSFHQTVVRGDPACDAIAFRPVDVRNKEFRETAWVALPDTGPAPPRHRHRRLGQPPVRGPSGPSGRAGRRRSWRRAPSRVAGWGRRALGARLSPRNAGVLVVAVVLLLAPTACQGPPEVAGCALPVQLNVLASREVVDELRDLVVKFEDAERAPGELRCAGVRVHVAEGPYSVDVVRALGDGLPVGDGIGTSVPEPHVWIPASGLELEQARARLDAGRSRSGLRLHSDVDGAPSVVARSTVAVGVPRRWVPELPARENAREVSWRSLLGADGWRLFGLEPAETGSAQMATVAAVSGWLGEHGLGPGAGHQLHRMATRVGAEEPGGAGGGLCGDVRSVLVAGEAELVDRLDECGGLEVFYPEGGSLWLDHLFVDVVRTPSGDAEPSVEEYRATPVGEAAAKFRDFLLGDVAAQDRFRRSGLRDAAGGNTATRGLRPSGPTALPIPEFAARVREVWTRLRKDTRVVLVVADGSELGRAAVDGLVRMVEPPSAAGGDRVELVVDGARPLRELVAEQAARDRTARDGVAQIVVVAGARDDVGGGFGPVSERTVVGVGVGAGACDPSTELRALLDANGGECLALADGSGTNRVVEQVAGELWDAG
ncbi:MULTISPECIES: substrate-binding domain-containing protein [Actinosynnema]|uniref:substrate-binding domain-containing protein n=1 Tax=Actinosynnema TaxID=40566 RepID=UPI002646FB05|nr:substrate-binding domain-containing protein [Actinosynnema pretiosum]MCP2093108.1 extracellular solute-binding protein [Actinosynnema pretiosum]